MFVHAWFIPLRLIGRLLTAEPTQFAHRGRPPLRWSVSGV